MRLRVEFYGPLRDVYDDTDVDVAPGATVEAVLQLLKVDDRYFVVLADDDPISFSAAVPDRARSLKLVPPIGGGCL
ncbi:MAG TPA: MoaD/ThiS family protein [Symbiobacteriaceae bacterium]|nr:MoaD/ThiS family protein [Symbiobacteriaceae bacterium]